MGSGISLVAALAGFDILLFDLDPAVADRALGTIATNLDKGIEKGKITKVQKEEALSRIKKVTELNQIQADLVIEAIVEDLEVKKRLFKDLEEFNNNQTILASNTSSIRITEIGTSLKDPSRLIGLHFFNPAHILKLVEVISGDATDPDVIGTCQKLITRMGKVPVPTKDTPGFIVNRVARHYYVESLKTLEDDIASFETIDLLLESSGFKMGPFKLMDLIGIDTNYLVTTSLYEGFDKDPKFKPNPIQQKKITEGNLGKKTGKGFYNYS